MQNISSLIDAPGNYDLVGRTAVVALLINVRTLDCGRSCICAYCNSFGKSQMTITLSSDYIYVIAMLKTTPLVVTVGLSLTMPLAVLGDFFLGRPAKAQVVFGAVIVISSFVALGFEDSRNAEDSDLISGDRIDQEAGSSGVRLEDEVPLSE